MYWSEQLVIDDFLSPEELAIWQERVDDAVVRHPDPTTYFNPPHCDCKMPGLMMMTDTT